MGTCFLHSHFFCYLRRYEPFAMERAFVFCFRSDSPPLAPSLPPMARSLPSAPSLPPLISPWHTKVNEGSGTLWDRFLSLRPHPDLTHHRPHPDLTHHLTHHLLQWARISLLPNLLPHGLLTPPFHLAACYLPRCP